MKTSELTDLALDWAVATCQGLKIEIMTAEKQHPKSSRIASQCTPEQEAFLLNRPTYLVGIPNVYTRFRLAYSTDWSQGGPIIEREEIDVLMEQRDLKTWAAEIYHSPKGYIRQRGRTPLIAAMRCYVASKLGDTIDIPKELT